MSSIWLQTILTLFVGEAGVAGEKGPDPKNFTIFINEYTTKKGTYSVTYRQPDSSNNNKLSVIEKSGKNDFFSETESVALFLDPG